MSRTRVVTAEEYCGGVCNEPLQAPYHATGESYCGSDGRCVDLQLSVPARMRVLRIISVLSSRKVRSRDEGGESLNSGTTMRFGQTARLLIVPATTSESYNLIDNSDTVSLHCPLDQPT